MHEITYANNMTLMHNFFSDIKMAGDERQKKKNAVISVRKRVVAIIACQEDA